MGLSRANMSGCLHSSQFSVFGMDGGREGLVLRPERHLTTNAPCKTEIPGGAKEGKEARMSLGKIKSGK